MLVFQNCPFFYPQDIQEGRLESCAVGDYFFGVCVHKGED